MHCGLIVLLLVYVAVRQCTKNRGLLAYSISTHLGRYGGDSLGVVGDNGVDSRHHDHLHLLGAVDRPRHHAQAAGFGVADEVGLEVVLVKIAGRSTS